MHLWLFLFWVFLWPFCAALRTAAASSFVFCLFCALGCRSGQVQKASFVLFSLEIVFCIIYFFFFSRHRPQWCLCLHFNPQAKRLLVDRQKRGVSASPQRRNISGQRRVICWILFYFFLLFLFLFIFFVTFLAPLSFQFALCFSSSCKAARWVFSGLLLFCLPSPDWARFAFFSLFLKLLFFPVFSLFSSYLFSVLFDWLPAHFSLSFHFLLPFLVSFETFDSIAFRFFLLLICFLHFFDLSCSILLSLFWTVWMCEELNSSLLVHYSALPPSFMFFLRSSIAGSQ